MYFMLHVCLIHVHVHMYTYVLYGRHNYDVMVFHICELFTYMNMGESQGVWISEGPL